MRSPINFNYLESFFAVAQSLSFSKAALTLGIAQPAISKQVKALEEQLETELFIRNRHQVKLSPEGQNFYQKTWPLFKEICTHVENEIHGNDEISGTIVVGCLEEVGEKVFIHSLNEFKKKFPKLKILMRLLKGYEIIEGVKDASIDIGIVPNEIIQENIRSYRIFEERILLVTGSKTKIKNFKSLKELPFIAYRENDPLLEYYLKSNASKLKYGQLNIEFYVNSHKAMIEVLKKNPFYAVMPELSIFDELKKGQLVKVKDQKLKSNIYLIHREQSIPEPKITLLREHIQNFTKKISQ
ncbi:MAG: LysR family transcriptional regulator [Bacteriovoracaceae bacterium]